MRVIVLVLVGLAAAACSPEIGKGTYFCGPERFCPPDMECDEPSFTCESARLADRFSCPTGSNALEPNDSGAEATDEGVIDCGEVLVTDRIGCVEGEGDEDFLAFEVTGDCVGDDPHLPSRCASRSPSSRSPSISSTPRAGRWRRRSRARRPET